MKKPLGWLLCVMLLVFGVTLSLQAYAKDPINAGHIDSYGGIYLGGTDDLVAFGWNDCSTYHPDQDKSVNVAKTVELWNIPNNPDYALPITPYVEVETGYPIDYTGGTIRWNDGFQFLSMNWDSVFGLWFVGDAHSLARTVAYFGWLGAAGYFYGTAGSSPGRTSAK